MISEKDIRRAIRLAIKAKQIEKNPIIEEEENFGVTSVQDDPTFIDSDPKYNSFYKKLKNNLKEKEEKIEKAKRSHVADVRRYLA